MQRLRVLVIDPSPTVRQITSQALFEGGFAPVQASSLDEATRALADLPAAIVTEFHFPTGDALSWIAELRGGEKTKPIALVVVTTELASAQRKAAFRAGAHDWLIKPATQELLCSTLTRLLGSESPAK